MFGFSASTGGASEVHEICSWEFNSSLPITSSNGNTWKWWIILLMVLGGVAAFALLLTFLRCIYTRFYRKSGSNKSIQEALGEEDRDRPKEYPYEKLKSATDDFAENRVLGGGSFGKVY
ncbi:hypothetical protein CDL15_Pgr016412 [Punica granatum]|uniref:L-type lectin-like domain-containing protein n=1 Tax=Punica granatum TaxID=22663 RepID=A0A218XST1_PUNGR|nr:hypothetical protein CDL15_Pgr016412 [Punica granatum]